MVTVLNQRLVTDALLAAALVAHPRVGDGQVPTDETLPYAVLYSIDIGDQDGPQDDGAADVQLLYQVTSVAVSREQAEGLGNAIGEGLQNPAAPITLSGRLVLLVEPISLGGAIRDDDPQLPLFEKVDLYSALTTPS